MSEEAKTVIVEIRRSVVNASGVVIGETEVMVARAQLLEGARVGKLPSMRDAAARVLGETVKRLKGRTAPTPPPAAAPLPTGEGNGAAAERVEGSGEGVGLAEVETAE